MVIANWNDERRRTSSYAVLGVAAAILLGALAAWWFMDSTPAWLYWTLVGILVLVLAFMVLLFVLKPSAIEDGAVEAAPAEAEAMAQVAAPVEAAPVQAYEPRVLTLRCGDCGTIFDVNDTGERPLYHTCPGCAAEGALRDAVEAPVAADQAYARPQEAVQSEAPVRSAPAPAASAAAPGAAPKKLKLRCGGCKEVFSIEDSGERPLKRGCPNCGRMGIIR